MVWHDCKTDPPKKSGFYILVYEYDDGCSTVLEKTFDRGWYSERRCEWQLFENEIWTNVVNVEQGAKAIKWAEVDLSEVE